MQKTLHLPHLQSITLFYNNSATDAGLGALLENVGRTLEHLNLSTCTQLGDGTLQAAAIHCLRLCTVDMTRCDRITDAGLIEFVRLLQSRNFDDQQVASNVFHHPLVHHAHHHYPLLPVKEPQLQHVNLSCCQFSDRGATALKHIGSLVGLNLSYNSNLTQAALKAILDEPACKLKVLFAIGCNRLQFDENDIERWAFENKKVCTGLSAHF